MAISRSLAEFVTLGQRLYILQNPQVAHVDLVITEINGFVRSLDACGLERTKVAAHPLTTIESIPYLRNSGAVGPVAAKEIKAYLEPIYNTLFSELGEQHAILVNVGIVSQELRNLPTQLTLTSTQSDLLNETIICIECGAYRSGVVMGWNFAYDYIRQWVFDSHLPAFNQELTTRYLKKDKSTPVYEPIATYSDFLTGKPDERTVLETCHYANIFGEKIRDNLVFYLRRRNNYAHPTFTSPSADQTNGYLKDLLDTIKEAPFV